MRIIGLLITLLLCGTMQSARAQGIRASLPDTISLSDGDIYRIFKSSNDTLGFRKLTYDTSLDNYEGRENRAARRALRRIKMTMQNDVIFDKLAGRRISSLQGIKRSKLPGHYYSLCSPKYALTSNGFIIIGLGEEWAPWYDIIVPWIDLDYYFVGYNKKVTYIKTKRYDKEFPTKGHIILLSDSSYFDNPDSFAADNIDDRIPPAFAGGIDSLRRFVERETKSGIVLDNVTQGVSSVSFRINPDTSITDVEITESIDAALDRELIRIVKLMNGLWDAGKVNGAAVPVQVKLAVWFHLIW